MADTAPSRDTLLQEYEPVRFQADSALLRELGERLVGQPHIALAELIKNAYDADATECTIFIDEDAITVTDNGHGMTRKEFLAHWMTIGTRNKQDRGESRYLNRNVTGSKGVGRLSAQFLAHRLEILTVPRERHTKQLRALVDWDDAIEAGNLTEAEAFFRIEHRNMSFPRGKPYGTCVTMRDLKQSWREKDIRDLGRQLWMIQSPIQEYGILANDKTDPTDFHIELSSALPGVQDTFDDQMKIALTNYFALITGELERDGKKTNAHVEVSFRSGEHYSENFSLEPLVGNAKWEIRIFNLSGRQPGGIDVGTARNYFERFGGVQVYDAGFRLPYYGVDQDWLAIEFDHSHRRNKSALLPERLHVRRALNDLPTQGRLFGVVSIDTGNETRRARKFQRKGGTFLKIQVTRDRLVTNEAYQCLRDAVRWSLDYYATRQRLKEQKKLELLRPDERANEKLSRLNMLLQEALEAHPNDEALVALEDEFDNLSNTIERERHADLAAQTLLGPLASAGMAALALEHESRKEMRRARQLTRKLRRIGKELEEPQVTEIGDQVKSWVDRVEDTRRLFAPLLDPDDRDAVEALAAGAVLRQVISNVRPLVSGLGFSVTIPKGIHFPAATFAEWNSLFQNIFVNAANATLDLDERRVFCSGGRTGRSVWIRVEDNGYGVDCEDSDELFEPFTRYTEISEERRALGLGGMGLGLTIVRMIAEQRYARAAFVEPSPGWTTAFQLSWGSSR